MNYEELHLINWLNDRKCLKIDCIEQSSGVPSGTLRHFLKERRSIPKKHYHKICETLYDYGFKNLED